MGASDTRIVWTWPGWTFASRRRASCHSAESGLSACASQRPQVLRATPATSAAACCDQPASVRNISRRLPKMGVVGLDIVESFLFTSTGLTTSVFLHGFYLTLN